MHSSGMRTIRCSGRWWRGCIPACTWQGVSAPRRGVSAQREGVSTQGGVCPPPPSACWDTPPPCGQNDMLVKTLPFHVADGNNTVIIR